VMHIYVVSVAYDMTTMRFELLMSPLEKRGRQLATMMEALKAAGPDSYQRCLAAVVLRGDDRRNTSSLPQPVTRAGTQANYVRRWFETVACLKDTCKR